MDIKTIEPLDLYRHMKLGHKVMLLDIRPKEEYEQGHIAGATPYPFEAFQAEVFLRTIKAPRHQSPTIYVTCSDGTKGAEACKNILAAGHEYVTMMDGGIKAWKDAGLPLKRARTTSHITTTLNPIQQTQIALGAFFCITTLLGGIFSHFLLLIPVIAGMGLIFDGMRGHNTLQKSLEKMFWNHR